ncbi:MAG: SwmB domain-containing protein [Duganella sp.]
MAAILNRGKKAQGGGGATDIAFALSIPLASGAAAYMPQQNITGPLAFTPMANAVRGSLVYLRLVANGVNVPTFTGFAEWGGSMGWDNTSGVVNNVQFFADGYDTYVSVTQSAVAATVPGDTTAPVRQSATVNGATLVVAYNEALTTAAPALASFSYVLNGGTAVNPTAISVSGSSLTLSFATAALQGQAATLSYTPGTNPIRDAAGNAAAAFAGVAVTNNTPASDTTAPVIQSAAMNGNKLVMSYSEALNTTAPTLSAFSLSLAGSAGAAPTAAAVAGATVTLTFAAAATAGQAVALSYTAGAAPIRDTAGNNAANLAGYAVTNNTPASDTTAPVIQSATMNGGTLVMTYSETLNTTVPTLSAFSLSLAGGAGAAPTAAAVSGATVTLTFATAATAGQAAALSYTAGAAPIRDAAGNSAANLAGYAVTNTTAAVGSSTPFQFSVNPTYYTETVDGNGDYKYDSTSAIGSGYQAVSAASSAKSLPANADGMFWMTAMGAATLNSILGFQIGDAAPGQSSFANYNASILCPAVGSAYTTRVKSTATTSSVLAEANDLWGLGRFGGTIKAYVARAATPNTWIEVATIATDSTARLWAQMQAQQHPSQRTFSKPRSSGGWL